VGKGKRIRERRKTEAAQVVTTPDERVSEVSPLPPHARGFELKLAHAQNHLQHIDKLIQGWIDACLKSLREEPDPEELGYFCAWIDAPEIDTQRLSLLIGDCLQSLRSTLDHLAFELSSAFTVPMTDQIEKDSSFPILSDVGAGGAFGEGPHKWASARAKVCGMDPAAQTVIEGLQPYKRGNAYSTDPIWWLGELNNIDKHRVLHVARWLMSGATMPVNGPALPVGEWSTNVRAIGRADGKPSTLEVKGAIAAEGQTLVARWPMLSIDPRLPMHMNFRPVLDVVFARDTPLVADAPIRDVLGEIRDHIVSDVLPPLKAFL
jgi:hypothetical protein